MDFGKLENVDNVRFSMPIDDTDNARILNKFLTHKIPTIRIGCTGWSVREWSGSIYPQKIATSDFPKFYGKQFSTIEFNTTHYRTPEISDCERWHDAMPSDFRFAPKMLQQVSHAENLNSVIDLAKRFYYNLSFLKDKLGPIFIQFPPTFSPKSLNVLENFLKHTPEYIRLAVEVRHPTWFHEKNFNALKQLLENYKCSFVISDVSGRRDILHSSLTQSYVLIRFVGNSLHPTDYQRVDWWCKRIEEWLILGLEEIYFFSHQPENIKSPIMAEYFYEKMKSILNFPVEMRGQIFLETPKNDQLSLF